MDYSPFLLNPFTDFSYIVAPQHMQFPHNSLCAKLELKFMDCLEAYGSRKAREKCAHIVYDMHECRTSMFQNLRTLAIRKERMRQYREGKISKPFDEYPPLDSYMYLV